MHVLVIGSGYAGNLLTYFLVKNGADVTMVDRGDKSSATRISTGIMLPVTGRRLAKTHNADIIIPFAHNTYSTLSKNKHIPFFHEKEVLQLFTSAGNMNEWFARSDDNGFEKYTGEILSKEKIPAHILNEFGGILLQQSGYVNSTLFVQAVEQYCGTHLTILEQDFSIEAFDLGAEGVIWKNNFYDKLIFCEGFEATKNKYFSFIPFKPAKGELLDIVCRKLDDSYILNGPVFILPVGNGRFRVGSTYNWTDLNTTPTPEARETLENGLKSMISCEYEITNHVAGIRPSIKDRRPVIGMHPVYKQLGIFNGLGTKGAMQGPWYAHQMAQLILENKNPDSDVDLRRFASLYQAH